MSEWRKPLALTCGEPAGIGPEITCAAWARAKVEQLPAFFLVGEPGLLKSRGIDIPIAAISHPAEALLVFQEALPVIEIENLVKAVPGKPSAKTAQMVISSIKIATRFVQDGSASGIVTNPIQKATLLRAGFAYPGHTEFLAHLGAPHRNDLLAVMMLANEQMRTIPLTTHIPLSEVPGAISTELIIRTCRIAHADLKLRFAISEPHIAISGLNPHASEDGLLGWEERDIIKPAINALAAEGMNITGPYPADAMFRDSARNDFDVAVCMYHDQALLPVKTLGFHDSVNVTLGLPFIRTSPDHGTALNLAGTDDANPKSLIAAIKMAAAMAHISENA